MYERILTQVCFSPDFGRQMRFISGPRQVGKTTLVKQYLLKSGFSSLYYNWDQRITKDNYRKDAYFFQKNLYDYPKEEKKWICFDEIHKMRKWKDILKDYFDTFEDQLQIIVTGSANLEFFRKSGDSLAGRYFSFRLLPLSLREVSSRVGLFYEAKNISSQDFIEQSLTGKKYYKEELEQLLKFGPFPEPLKEGRENFLFKWQNDYIDRLIREDLRDLTRVIELENIATLIRILPQKIGSPFSMNSLREDLSISHTSIRNYIYALELGYIIFKVEPYSKNISRGIKKEKKIYLFDYALIDDEGKRFENFVALELLILTETWTSMGLGKFELKYIRTKDGKETDFVILKNNNPWILFEVKLKSREIESHHYKHSKLTGGIPFVQIVREENILQKKGEDFFQVSASRFF